MKKNSTSKKKLKDEEVDTSLSSEPVDRKDSDDYPSPRPNNREFTRRWKEFIPDVVGRENFKVGHLQQLEILCDMYTEYKKLRSLVIKHGHTYDTVNDKGVLVIKHRPEVDLMLKVRAEIRQYSKALGLLLVKDKNPGGRMPEGAEKWE